MDKKITRRAVIGTAVGGIAASSLIIRALKGKYCAELPQSEFEKGWDKHVKLLDVPIKEIGGPEELSLDFQPKRDSAFRVVSVSPCYKFGTGYPQYPNTPIDYRYTEAQVKVVSLPETDHGDALLIDTHGGSASQKENIVNPPSKCLIATKNGSVCYFNTGDSKHESIPVSKVGFGCIEIASDLTFDYPKNETITKGAVWNIPRSLEYGIELSCKVTGFAEVAGFKTAKMVAERHLNNQEVQSYIKWSMNQVKKSEADRGNDFDANAATKDEIKRVIKEKQEKKFYVECYVDLESGIVVHKKFAITTFLEKKGYCDRIEMFVSQVLRS